RRARARVDRAAAALTALQLRPWRDRTWDVAVAAATWWLRRAVEYEERLARRLAETQRGLLRLETSLAGLGAGEPVPLAHDPLPADLLAHAAEARSRIEPVVEPHPDSWSVERLRRHVQDL